MAKLPYLAYLLRIWPGEPGAYATWHASLEDAGTREVRGFEDLVSLCEYLRLAVVEREEWPGEPPPQRG